jgi:diguanylate cyclase (GGDEF)-like protein
MRRHIDRWWVIGSALIIAVIVLSGVLYAAEADRQLQQQRAQQQQAVGALSSSVDDVLAREVALARVVGTLPGPIGSRWAVLSTFVMSQPLANSTGYIQPVSERDRAAFQRRTGLRMFESPKPGVQRVAGRRPLHLVLTEYRQAGPGRAPLGLDVAANPLRRRLLSQAASSGHQLATPPVMFLVGTGQRRGVAVYSAVRDQRGRLKGWVTATYDTQQLASMVSAQMPGMRLTIRDGAATLISDSRTPGGPDGSIAVGGRRWNVWAEVPDSGISAVPWLVLSLGLAITIAVMLTLRQASSRARGSALQLALRDAEEAALGQIATLVAHGASPEAVFTSVAEQIVNLCHSRTGAVSRFDAHENQGLVVGGWTLDGQELCGATFALDGMTAAAAVYRTELPARMDGAYGSPADPISALMTGLGGKSGVAAPIVVGGQLWGAIGAAYGADPIPVDVELRLERFASLVALAISNADAWDRLGREASSDSLTGIGNRRMFDERLSAEVARADRYGRKLSLALLDLDHFKKINDLHGHQVGDRVLVLFAQLLAANARHGELVARIGGEEFAWLMPETDEPGAQSAAERVRSAIESSPFEHVGTVTLSAGVSSSDDAPDADTLFGNADRALYWAKDNGRNTTRRYSDGAPAAGRPSGERVLVPSSPPASDAGSNAAG